MTVADSPTLVFDSLASEAAAEIENKRLGCERTRDSNDKWKPHKSCNPKVFAAFAPDGRRLFVLG